MSCLTFWHTAVSECVENSARVSTYYVVFWLHPPKFAWQSGAHFLMCSLHFSAFEIKIQLFYLHRFLKVILFWRAHCK